MLMILKILLTAALATTTSASAGFEGTAAGPLARRLAEGCKAAKAPATDGTCEDMCGDPSFGCNRQCATFCTGCKCNSAPKQQQSRRLLAGSEIPKDADLASTVLV
mmetsp:Transcript_89497/g.158875  ORF Transcript_89497/g.158875 Transcript_89497/m.158875 type:complete len:106 (-) Transcript_89497:112-429(-)